MLLVSLYEALRDERYLDEAEGLVAEVNRVLGRPRGIRIGEEPDREGQYFHYLAMWLYALSVLGRYRPLYREQGVTIARQFHDPFVVPGRGVIWKMQEDLSGPYPGYGFGALDAFDGYVSYRLLDEQALAREIGEMYALIKRTAGDHSRSWPRHDLVACASPRRDGPGCIRGARSPFSTTCGSGRGILPGSPICRRCASPLPITASRWDCRRLMRCLSGWTRSMAISRPSAQAMSTIATPSPM
ncbi:MAG: hypothetical protein WBV51_26740 [Pseudolabrys sp.]